MINAISFAIIIFLLGNSVANAKTISLLCDGREKSQGWWHTQNNSGTNDPTFEPRTISIEISDLTDFSVSWISVGEQVTYGSEQCAISGSSASCSLTYTVEGQKWDTNFNLNRHSGHLKFVTETNWRDSGADYKKIWNYSGGCELFKEKKF